MDIKKPVYAICLFIFLTGVLLAQPYSKNREDIPNQYKWNLKDLYSDWGAWETDLKTLERKMDVIAGLKGSLKKHPDSLARALKLEEEMDMLAYRVYRYPQLTRDTDTRNQEVSAKLQQVQILFSKYSTATAWINPEVLEIPWETMKTWLETHPDLQPYRFNLENLYRQQEHVLDEDKEKLLSYFSQFRRTPRSIYSELSTSDIDFPEVVLSTGDTLRATHANYSRVLATNRNQADRRAIFVKHYNVFKDNVNTYAAIYNAVCQRDWATAQARGYQSTLEAALDGNNIPTTVYENLVNTVKANTEPLKRYIRLRKKVLGLEEYHSYDGSIPLVEFDRTYPYEQAKTWALAAVSPLGENYVGRMREALQGGWIDVFENTGKRSGAYSAGVYGIHPFMLMNYNETLSHVFTLSHELGHTLHTVLANEHQPFATHDYTIFVAEVASTFNERLLLDYLLQQSDDPKERVALLQQAIRNITGTFYFQTLLADYEWKVHKRVESGQPVTAETLSGIMADLLKSYYGESTVTDELLNVVWARISHFYNMPYYVYQYATCFASSAQLYKQVIDAPPEERDATRERYLDLLRAGGNNYPMQQLRDAGVDLSKPEPVLAVIQQLDELVDQLEEEVTALGM
jgi:oligoendopeptidase F